MKPAPNEPKAFKYVVMVAVVLVSAIIIGVISVLVTTFIGGQSEAGQACPDKVGRYLRRFAGATIQPRVVWSGCKVGQGLVLRSSFDLDSPGPAVLRAKLQRRGFRKVQFPDDMTGWVRRTDEQRTVIVEQTYRESGVFNLVHAESGIR